MAKKQTNENTGRHLHIEFTPEPPTILSSESPYEEFLRVGDVPFLFGTEEEKKWPITYGASRLCAVFCPFWGDFTSLRPLSMALLYWTLYPRHCFRLVQWPNPKNLPEGGFTSEDFQRGRQRLRKELKNAVQIMSRHAQRMGIDSGRSFMVAETMWSLIVDKWPTQVDPNFDDRDNADWKDSISRVAAALPTPLADMWIKNGLDLHELTNVVNAAHNGEQWALDNFVADQASKDLPSSPVTLDPPQKTLDGGSAHQPLPKRAANGKPGAPKKPDKRKRAEYANKLKEKGKAWKEIADGVNSRFRLTGGDKYTFEKIRSLWKHFFPPEKKR